MFQRLRTFLYVEKALSALQALALTDLMKADKLKSDGAGGEKVHENDTPFRTRAIQSIKASQQSKSGTFISRLLVCSCSLPEPYLLLVQDLNLAVKIA